MTVKVGIRQDKTGQYGPQNTVRYNVGAGTPQGAAKAPTAAAQPRQAPQQGRPPLQAAKGAVKPWNQPKLQQAAPAEDPDIPF